MILLLLLQSIACLHYYADAGEERCFTEELPPGTSIVGSYKADLWDSSKNAFGHVADTKVSIVVTHIGTAHDLVRQISKTDKGKFRFTATDAGVHKLCLYVYQSSAL